MTGNLMWFATALSEANLPSAIYYVTVITSYIAGLISFRKAELTFQQKSLSKFCAPLILSLFVLADALSSTLGIRWPSAALLSFGFGIINSVGTEIAGTLAFVVTGHMTKLTQMFTDRISRQAGKKTITETQKETAKQSWTVIGGFGSGAFAACVAHKLFPQLLSRWGGFTILGLFYGLLFLWQDRAHLRWLSPKQVVDMDVYVR